MTGPDARSGGTTRRFALLALIAAELLMSFSFFGYFHVEPISVTTAYLPVLLAGALTGPPEAAAVGAVFGLASMWKASASYVMAADQLFSPPLQRQTLWGAWSSAWGAGRSSAWRRGFCTWPARRLRRPWVGVAAVSFLGRTIHSLLVYSAMGLFFPESRLRPRRRLLGGLLSRCHGPPGFNLATAGDGAGVIWRALSRLPGGGSRFQSGGWSSGRDPAGPGRRSRHRVSLAAVSASWCRWPVRAGGDVLLRAPHGLRAGGQRHRAHGHRLRRRAAPAGAVPVRDPLPDGAGGAVSER